MLKNAKLPRSLKILSDLGVSPERFRTFQRALLDLPHAITCGWNPNFKSWILGRVGRFPGTCTYLKLNLGHEAMAAVVEGGAEAFAREFDAMEMRTKS